MATIVLSSEQVIAACNTTIKRIRDTRNSRDEAKIKKTMKPIGLWRWKYTPSRDQAIKLLDKISDIFGWRSYYAWGDLEHAHKLLLLAEHGDPVTLNEEDVKVIFNN